MKNPSVLKPFCLQSFLFVLLAMFLSLEAPQTRAQIAGALDPAFDPAAGANGGINVARLQSDGKIIAGGEFTLFNGGNYVRLVRLNANGSVDGSFSPAAGFNGTVEDVAIQTDGKVLVGGSFNQVNNLTHNFLVRLAANGSIDSAFNPGIDGSVDRIILQGDGKIVIGGNFLQVNGQPRARVARLNTDGTLDATFVPPDLNGTVLALALQADGRIVVGGSFSLSYLGISYYYLVRLNSNGSLEQGFNAVDPKVGIPINSTVQDVLVQPDQRILIAGSFSSVNSESRPYIARLMPSGRVDGTFNTGSGPNQSVRNIALQPEGKVVIAGDFTEVASAQRKYVARLNATGALDTTFDPGIGPDARIESIALTSGGKLLIAGDFQAVDGVSRNHIAQLTDGVTVGAGTLQVSDVEYRVLENAGSVTVGVRRLDGGIGAVSVDYTTGTGSTVGSAEVVTDFIATSGTLSWANGDTAEKFVTIPIVNDNLTEIEERFTLILSAPTGGANIGPANVATVVIVNDDPGILDTTFDSGAGALGQVNGVAVQPDGKVVIGGDFTWVLSQNRNRFARLNADGTLDASFNVGAGADSVVNDVELQPDGKILLGGSFTQIQGHTRNNLARLNADGTLDLAFNPGVDSTVLKIFLQPDGKMLIGGNFSEVNGVNRRSVARLHNDGSLDNTFQPAPGINGSVNTIAEHADGRVLIGGSFSLIDHGQTFYYLARLDAFGNTDRSFNGYTPSTGLLINSSVLDIAVQNDDRILIGGDFTNVRGVTRERLARLMPDGSLDGTFVTENGANGSIRTLALQPNGQVLIAGDFSQVASATRNNLARFNADGSLDTGFDPVAGPDDGVQKIALMANGKIVVGGDFRHFSSFPRGGVARVNSVVSPASPGTFQVGAINAIVSEGGGSVTIEVRRLNGSLGPVSINYATVTGTAGAGADFTPISGTLNWGNGDTTAKTVTIPILEDGLVEGDETFGLKLSAPTGGAGLSEANTATITIDDNDPGLLDLTYAPAASIAGAVFDLAAQADGKAVIGGDFTWIGAVNRNHVARLNFDGSLDTTFFPGIGANANVNAVAVQADHRILVGGDFNIVDGQSRNFLARFEENGSLDATFVPGVDGSVQSITLQSDGRILIGGNFSNVNGEERDSVARFNADGSLDLSFNPVPGISGSVFSIARQADGKFLIGGSFSLSFKGKTYYYLVRLNADGTLEEGFNVYDPNIGLPINSTVQSIVIQPDQHFLIGGSFNSVRNQSRRSIARLNPDGSLDLSFDPGTAANSTVQHVLLQADGKILIGGNFTQVADTARNYVARLNSDGSLDPTFDVIVGPNGPVQTMALLANNQIYIGGSFTEVNGFPSRGVARLQSGGTAHGSFLFSAANVSVNENGGNAAVKVSRLGGGFGSVSVNFATSNGSATAGSDYTATSGALFWGDGDVSQKTILIPIINDAAIEGNETINVALSNPTGGATISLGNSTVTILDNSAANAGALQFSAPLADVSENDGSVIVGVRRPIGSAGIVTVNYATASGTATSGADFTPQSGTLTFADGEYQKTFSVPIINDFIIEGTESFTITLSNPTGGATLGAFSTTEVDIHDNDLNPAPGSVDLTFDPGAGANGEVFDVVVQSDGKFVVGGDFTQYAGVTVNRIVRVGVNGVRDPSFSAGTGFNGAVGALALQGDGKIVVGGSFQTVNGSSRPYLVRLQSNGSLDTGFNIGIDGAVNAILLQSNGKILIGGAFNTVGGAPHSSVARLNSDGTVDTSFNSPVDGTVYTLAQQADGKFLVGGSVGFSFEGRSYYYLARLNNDGSLEEEFNAVNPAFGFPINSTVWSIAVQNDGRILVGGDFSVAGSAPRAHVARLLADSSIDPTFDPGDGPHGAVKAIATQADGKVIIGGRFAQVSNSERHRMARLEPTGALDTSFAPMVEPDNSGVNKLLLLSGNRVLIAGDFTAVGSVARNGLAVLNAPSATSVGQLQFALSQYEASESVGTINVVVRRLGGSVGPAFVRYQTAAENTPFSAQEGSDFVAASGTIAWADGEGADKTIPITIVNDNVPEVNERFTISLFDELGAPLAPIDTATITIVNDDPGMLDLTFDPGQGTLGRISAIAVQTDDKVVAVGEFQWALGGPRSRVARFNSDGTLDATFDPGLGADSFISAVALQADGKILIGGDFSAYNGVPRLYLARLNSDGSLDSSFSPSLDGAVRSILAEASGAITIGGNFGQVNGAQRSSVAVLNADGTSSATFVASPDVGGTVYALARQADGKLLIGGSFSLNAAGATYYYLARLNPNGTVENDFNVYNPNIGLPINSTVMAITLQPDGRILIGGDFTSVQGQSRGRIARLMPNGRLDGTFLVGSGANNRVEAISLLSNGNVLIGGNFDIVASARRTYLARLNTDGSLDTGFDPVSIDGEVTDIAPSSNNKHVIGGQFTEFAGFTRGNLARINPVAELPLPGSIQVSAVDYFVLESVGNALVGVRRHDGSVGAISVNYTTINGTAQAGSDYTTTSGVLNWADGETTEKFISIPIANDGNVEEDETFTVLLSNPTGGAGLDEAYQAVVHIVNDDLEGGLLDLSFAPNNGANGEVHKVLVDSGDKVIIGGEFTQVNGVARNRIARLNSDGSLDTSFDPGSGVNSTVESMGIDLDGKILVGGSFTSINGRTRNYLARLNPDGSLDEGFTTGLNSTVYALMIEPNGQILVAGDFDEVNGVPTGHVARINSDGSLDLFFQAPPTISGPVRALAHQSNGRIVIGGSFSVTQGGRMMYYLARLLKDGQFDDSFMRDPRSTPATVQINSTVFTIAVDANDRIVIGGDFNSVQAQSEGRLARLLPDGLLDGTFDTGAGPNTTVRSVALLPNGQMVIAGAFTQVNSVPRNRIARLNNNGLLDPSFDPGTGPNGLIETMTLMANGKLVVGGDFTQFNSYIRQRVARLNAVPTPSAPGTIQADLTSFWTMEANGIVEISVSRIDGSQGAVSVAYNTQSGTATVADYTPTSGVLSWADGETGRKYIDVPVLGDGVSEGPEAFSIKLSNPTGGAVLGASLITITVYDDDPGLLDVKFNSDMRVQGEVYDVAPQNDGKVVIGGNFQWVDGIGRNRIARLNSDGTLDWTFNPGTGANGNVVAVAVQADNRVLLGGDFTTLDGQPRNYLARYESNGSLDPSFSPGVDSSVECLLIQADNKILIGGEFTFVNGEHRDSIARLNNDGSLDLTFVPMPGINGPVRAIARQADGKYLLGGGFSLNYAGKTYYYLIRLNADGTLDDTFNVYNPNIGLPINSTVQSVVVQPDQKILIGGSFNVAGNAARRGVARLNADGTLDGSFDIGNGVNGTVNSLALQSDGKVLLAGNFNQVEDTSRRFLARLNSSGVLDSTFNPGSGPDASVDVIKIAPDGRIFIGGQFSLFSGFPRQGVARLLGGGTNPGTIQFASANYVTSENIHRVKFIATRTGGSAGAVSVDFTTIDGSAHDPSDYLGLAGTIHWGDGDSEPIEFSVQIIDDGVPEGSENFQAKLSNPTGGATLGVPATTTITILDDSAVNAGVLQFAAASYNVTEDAHAVAVTVNRSGGSMGVVTVQYGTTAGTANGDDFESQNGTLTFQDGETTQTILLPIKNDLVAELPETFSVTLSNPTGGATVGVLNTTTITIVDNDLAPVAGALDATFNPGAGANQEVYAVAAQTDGKFVAGGEFTQFDGVTVNRIVRMNSDGSRDVTFGAGAGFNSTVTAVAVQADGKILVGGSFTLVNNITRNYLARLNSNGSLDSAFNAGLDNAVYSILIQNDGKIIIGGSFDTVGAQTRRSVARLNTDGSLDATFNSPADGQVLSVVQQPDGKFLIGGSFGFSFKGVNYYYMARLNNNGSLDEGFNAYYPNSGIPINSTVRAIALQPDARILIGGDFTSVGNVSRQRIARLMPDGSMDETFDTGAGANSAVYSIGAQADGKVIIGGRFTQVALAERRRLARLEATGALDSSFNADVESNVVDKALILGGGRTLIAGDFNSVNGTPVNGVAVVIDPTAPAAGVLQFADTDYRVPENAASAVLLVHRLDGGVGAASVHYQTGVLNPPFSAEEGTDFTPVSGDLTWADGDVADKQIVVPIVNGSVTEVEERFTVSLTDATGAALGQANVATVTIVNDDPGLLDLGFNSGAGTLGRVNSVAVQSDDKAIVVGEFQWALGASCGRIARLNPDGSLDGSFDPGSGANSTIRAVAVQADGKVLIGGDFTSYNGVARNYLARLNANGTLDTAFNPGVNSSVSSILVESSGAILIGGNFNQVNSQSRQSIARLNSDGSIDSAFLPPPFSGTILNIAKQADGAILAAGNFSVFEAGITYYYLARLHPNGSLDYLFNPYLPSLGLPINSTVQTVVVQPDQRILIGGDFTSVLGQSRSRIARLLPDGSLDGTFNVGNGANNTVFELALQPDGKVLLAGRFTLVANAERSYLARLNGDGSLDSGFDPIGGPNGELTSVVLASGNKAVVGGEFTAFNSFPRGNVARISYVPTPVSAGVFQVAETVLYVNEGAGSIQVPVRRLQGSVGAVSLSYKTTSGTAGAGADFTSVTGTLNWAAGDTSDKFVTIPILEDAVVEANETFTLDLYAPVGGALDDAAEATIVIINNDPGILNLAFDPDSAVLGNVMDLKVQPDGKVVIGGDFTWVWRASRNRIARLNSDGSLDTSFNPGTGANGTVNAVVVQPDGKILIGGDFTTVNGVGRKYLARFESNGSLDADFNPGIDNSIETIQLQSDGKILIGGNFNQVNGETRSRIARLGADGSLDLGFGPPSGFSGTIFSIARQADGKVLAGGNFSIVTGGVTYYYLVRLNANGSIEAGFNAYNPAIGLPINSTVQDIQLQPDTKILIGGSFNSVQQTSRSGIARLNADGSLDASFNIGNGVNGTVMDIELQSDGKVLVGGSFTQVQSIGRNRFARFNSDGSLDLTFDPYIGPDATVRVVKALADGSIYLGGDFDTFNAYSRVGVARLFGTAEPPKLLISRGEGRQVILRWPVSATGYTLIATDVLGPGANWQPVNLTVNVQGDYFVVVVPNLGAMRFFELRSP